ncbi:MAG: multidrug transporter [Eubacteriales bacterium]
MEPTKKDWKMYREKIGGWQEKYMERLVQEYIEYLQKDIPASTKFWEMEKRIKTDKKKPGVVIEMSKSNMIWDIARLIHDGAITIDDLDGFSEELIESVEYILKR